MSITGTLNGILLNSSLLEAEVGSLHHYKSLVFLKGSISEDSLKSGIFMVCNNPEVIAQHHAKYTGKQRSWAPPMSVPHLDTRFINNKKSLLFGTICWFFTEVLKDRFNVRFSKFGKTEIIS